MAAQRTHAQEPQSRVISLSDTRIPDNVKLEAKVVFRLISETESRLKFLAGRFQRLIPGITTRCTSLVMSGIPTPSPTHEAELKGIEDQIRSLSVQFNKYINLGMQHDRVSNAAADLVQQMADKSGTAEGLQDQKYWNEKLDEVACHAGNCRITLQRVITFDDAEGETKHKST